MQFQIDNPIRRKRLELLLPSQVFHGLNGVEFRAAAEWLNSLRAPEQLNVKGVLQELYDFDPVFRYGAALIAAGSSAKRPFTPGRQYGDIDLFLIPRNYHDGVLFTEDEQDRHVLGRLQVNLAQLNCFCSFSKEYGTLIDEQKRDAVLERHGVPITCFLLWEKHGLDTQRKGKGDIVYATGLSAEQLIEMNSGRRVVDVRGVEHEGVQADFLTLLRTYR